LKINSYNETLKIHNCLLFPLRDRPRHRFTHSPEMGDAPRLFNPPLTIRTPPVSPRNNEETWAPRVGGPVDWGTSGALVALGATSNLVASGAPSTLVASGAPSTLSTSGTSVATIDSKRPKN